MTIEDVYVTLTQQNMITILDAAPSPKPLPGQSIRFPKGRKNGVARRHLQRVNTKDDDKLKGPFVPPRSYKIQWDRDYVEDYMAKWEAKGYLRLKPDCLKWSPFIIARTGKFDGVITKAEDNSENVISPLEEESQIDELDTPGAGPSDALRATDSPLALFDDDNTEVVTPAKRRSPRKRANSEVGRAEEEEEEVRSLRTSPRKKGQVEVLLRRTRRQSGHVPSTPSPKKSPSSPSLLRRPSSSTLRRRRSSMKVPPVQEDPPPMTPEDHLAQDAALAAKLAMEEGRPRTRLRSHSYHEHDLKAVITPIRPRPTRKRRRAELESSPEPELSSPETPRQIQTRRSSAINQLRSTPVNGKRTPVKRLPATPLQRQNSRSTRASRRIRSPTASHASESEHEAPPAVRREEEEEEEEEEPASKPVTHGAEPHLDGTGDVKSEVADTPFTNSISRHSAPSDDTICVPDEHREVTKGSTPALVISPTTSNGMNGDLHSLRQEEEEEEEPQTAVAPSAGQIVFPTLPAVSGPNDMEEDLDADAEGEPDIDAEGDDDIDAEGEPDEDVEYEVL